MQNKTLANGIALVRGIVSDVLLSKKEILG